MRIRPLIAAVLLATCGALPAGAAAAVTIGSPLSADATDQAPPGTCMIGACTYVQTDGAAVGAPQYVVPATIPVGVITSWSFKASSGDNALQVLRPAGPAGDEVAVAQSPSVAALGGNTAVASAVQIPVRAGDAIALLNDSNAFVLTTNPLNFAVSDVVREFSPAAGAIASAPSSAADHSQLELQATVQPDADGDGFGDDTQDQCPSDPLRQTACSADLEVHVSAGAAAVKAGQLAAYTITVHNAGTSPAANATLAVTLPAGRSPASLSTTVGSCGATGCSLGTLVDGATVTVTAAVATTTPGPLTLTAAASSAVADPDPADDTAAATTAVTLPDLTLGELSVAPRRFRRGTGAPRLSAHARAASAITFTLSEAATVRLTFARLSSHGRTLSATAFSIAAPAGHDRLIFSGVAPDHRPLRSGTYKLTAAAQTGDGRRAAPASIHFTLLAAGAHSNH